MRWVVWILGIALCLIGPAAGAQEKVVVATCVSGQGCDCLLSDMTVEEARILLGEAPPPGVEPLLVQFSGGFVWSRVSASDIDLVLGGDGECEMALFPAIEPNDGLWRGTVAGQTVQSCPPGVDAALAPGLAGINQTRRMSWNGVFHPGKISDYQAPVTWTEVTSDKFTGVQALPGNTGAVSMGATWAAEIKTPDYVDIDMDFALGSSAAQAAIVGLANCRIHVDLDFRRIGN